MAAPAQAPQLSYILESLQAAGCDPAQGFTPYPPIWDRLSRITTGAVELLILRCIRERTWNAKGLRKGDPKPLYSEPLSYQQFAVSANCSRNMAKQAITHLIARGLIEVLGVTEATKLNLVVPNATSKRQYRLLFERWPSISPVSKTKVLELPESEAAEDIADDDEPAGDLPVGGRMILLPGGRVPVEFSEPVSRASINNQSTGAQLDFRQRGCKISVVIRDADKPLTRPTKPTSSPSASPSVRPISQAPASGRPAHETADDPQQPAATGKAAPKSKPGPETAVGGITPALVGAMPADSFGAKRDTLVRETTGPAPACGPPPLAPNESAVQIQECVAALGAPILRREAREIAAILHSGSDQPVDLAWFCTSVQQRAARDARKHQAVTYPVLKFMAQDAARELWPQEAQRRRNPAAEVQPRVPASERTKYDRLHEETSRNFREAMMQVAKRTGRVPNG